MKKYFPWRLYRRFFQDILAALFLTLLICYGASRSILENQWLSVFILFLVLIIISTAWLAYKFTLPLKRVILKSLRLANKKLVADYNLEEEAELYDSEPGEYFELEQSLEKIRKKLRRRRMQIAHEREESKALMSAMEDAVVSVGQDEKIVYFNSTFAALFLSREQILLAQGPAGLSLQQVLRDPEIYQYFIRALRSAESSKYQRRIATQFETQGRYFSVTVSPLREEKNSDQIYAALGLFHDITDIKRAEQIRIEFVENASHELRTPLTSVKGFAETLKEDLQSGKSDQAPHFLNIIIKNVDRLTELVQDMLTISTLENSSLLEFVDLDPALVTQEAIERLAPLAAEKSIVIHIHCEVPNLKADIHRLDQVLTNLIGNAIKYIPSGGKIQVSWIENDDHVELHVKDSGAGIAEEHLGRLFERFYRVDKARNRDIGGTGLGLSIVKHIMQAHSGSVIVKSQMGIGSEFICSFPKRRV